MKNYYVCPPELVKKILPQQHVLDMIECKSLFVIYADIKFKEWRVEMKKKEVAT